jgi:hypothetical protein
MTPPILTIVDVSTMFIPDVGSLPSISSIMVVLDVENKVSFYEPLDLGKIVHRMWMGSWLPNPEEAGFRRVKFTVVGHGATRSLIQCRLVT